MKIDKFLLKGYPNGDVCQKRFLVSFSNLDTLRRLPDCQVVQIIDCQVEGDDFNEVRTRKVETGDTIQYFKSERSIDFGRILDEKEMAISQEDFFKSQDEMYHMFKVVERTRYSFSNGLISSGKLAGLENLGEEGRGMFMFFDSFPFWNGFGLLTVRGSQAKDLEDMTLPGDLKIIKEVTRDKTFRTRVMATIDCTSFLE